MYIDYDADKLSNFMKDFYRITGIVNNVISDQLTETHHDSLRACDFCRLIQSTPEGERRCEESDHCLFRECHDSMEVRYHRCHAGLIDVAAPIIKENLVLGYILLGQISVAEEENGTARPLPFEEIEKRLDGIGGDRAELKKAYEALPQHDMEYIRSLVSIVNLLAKSVWAQDAIRVGSEDEFSRLLAYMRSHLNAELSVAHICTLFRISQTTLYARFHKMCSCTYNEYLTNLRIEKAKELLLESDASITETAEAVGIHDRFYFSRIFKLRTGMSPTQFRKQIMMKKTETAENGQGSHDETDKDETDKHEILMKS